MFYVVVFYSKYDTALQQITCKILLKGKKSNLYTELQENILWNDIYGGTVWCVSKQLMMERCGGESKHNGFKRNLLY